ncbi:protein of unknown function [Oenococcus oeni]|nr:hypothetical protein OENI_10523 [Oenococcus oeni]SYV99336.1 hypothetical protein OENI_150031 [Oenococcus oeni]SYW18162.1 hypothetical protein OENI_20232 [Oenococcus oeni]VDC15247.1 protein of unknown function [Oenococcus oeni]
MFDKRLKIFIFVESLSRMLRYDDADIFKVKDEIHFAID